MQENQKFKSVLTIARDVKDTRRVRLILLEAHPYYQYVKCSGVTCTAGALWFIKSTSLSSTEVIKSLVKHLVRMILNLNCCKQVINAWCSLADSCLSGSK